jgi:hypothetical protein
MIKYLTGIIEEFPEQIVGKSATPTGERLFDIRDKKDRKLLDEERAMAFHHTTAQLLFVATRARRDITDDRSLPDDKSEVARRGWLGKTKTGVKISERDQILEAHYKHEWLGNPDMVRGRSTQCTLGL